MADRTCAECGAPIIDRRRNAIYCTKMCNRLAIERRGRERRRAARPVSATCPYCEQSFKLPVHGPGSKYCSKRCYARARSGVVLRPARTCAGCGGSFTSNIPHKAYCSVPCRKREERRRHLERHGPPVFVYSESRRAADQRRRALKRGARTEVFTREDVAARDGWRCGLCGRKVNPKHEWPHPKSPSVDHIVPLSQGGEHSLRNVQLTHLVCNSRKGTKAVGEQLRLV